MSGHPWQKKVSHAKDDEKEDGEDVTVAYCGQ